MVNAARGYRLGGDVRLASCSMLSILGLVGNYFHISIGFNVDFLFGPIFSLVAVALFGTIPGVCVAFISSLATWLKWNHPYAIVIFTLEAAFYGLYQRKRPSAPIFTIDLTYWAFVGAPLVFLFYYGIMGISASATGTIALKQTLNGLCAAITASTLLNLSPLKNLNGGGSRRQLKNSTVTFEYTALMVMIPCLLGFYYMNTQDDRRIREKLASRVASSSKEAAWHLSNWLSQQKRAVTMIARLGFEEKYDFDGGIQHELNEFHQAFTDFHNLIVCDGNGTSVAFDPPVNERGENMLGVDFSQRQWFRKARGSKIPIVSDVFVGSANVFKPICVIAAPYYREAVFIGTGGGAIRLDSIERLLHTMAVQSGLAITVVDGTGNVVISTDPDRKPLSKLALTPVESASDLAEGVRLDKPVTGANISVMQSWKEARYYTTTEVDGSDWTLFVEGPLAPLQNAIYTSTSQNLAVLLAILLATNLTSFVLSRSLTRFYADLSEATKKLPERIESGKAVAWPDGLTVEARELVSNFTTTARALEDKIIELNRNRRELENQVAERTADLSTSNAKFRILFENELFGVALFDLERLTVLDLNVAFERMFGFSREEMLGNLNLLDLSAEPLASMEALCSLREGSPAFIPIRWVLKKSGERFPVEVFNGIYDWMGKKVVFSLYHDISDRLSAENRLKESESRWQFALDGSGQGVWDWNPQTGKVFFSSTWKSMLGFREDEITDSVTEWKNRIHPEDRARCLRDMEKHLNGFTEIYVNEHRVRCKDGTYKWFLDRGKVMARDEEGKPVRVIGTHSDVSNRKNAEESLKAAAEAHRVLLREVNHRVKNNLSTLIGLLRLEREKVAERRRKNVLHDLERRILALDAVHSLLSGSEWRPVRVNELLEKIIRSNIPLTASGEAKIFVTPSEMAVDARAAHNLALIANELAVNTQKHSGRTSGLEISVEITCYGGEAKIRYQDNGAGYPENILAGGLTVDGIGLGLVKGLVEASLGGTLSFDNEGGALTTIVFPLRCQEL